MSPWSLSTYIDSTKTKNTIILTSNYYHSLQTLDLLLYSLLNFTKFAFVFEKQTKISKSIISVWFTVVTTQTLQKGGGRCIDGSILKLQEIQPFRNFYFSLQFASDILEISIFLSHHIITLLHIISRVLVAKLGILCLDKN